jgi:ureidoglycolate lyase
MVIRPEALDAAAFSAFGQVLEVDEWPAEVINEGNTLKFADLANFNFGPDGAPRLSLYRSKAAIQPVPIRKLERHPLGSQAFIPLHARPFPVVVAPPGDPPGPGSIRAFMTNGRQGVNLNPGVWHHYQISLGRESDYLVIDRAGPGPNLEEHHLDGELLLLP